MNLIKFFEKNMCLILSFVLVCIISVSLANGGMLSENFDGKQDVPTCCLFHADWCPHCTKLMPVWNEFKKTHGSKCQIVEVEAKDKDIIKKHDVGGYPTIKFLPNGLSNPEGAKEFKGERDVDSLASFLNENVVVENYQNEDTTKSSDDEEGEEETQVEQSNGIPVEQEMDTQDPQITGFDGNFRGY